MSSRSYPLPQKKNDKKQKTGLDTTGGHMTNIAMELDPEKVTVKVPLPKFISITLDRTEKTMKHISPFYVRRALDGLVGKVKNAPRLRSGSLLVETVSPKQSETLLKAKLLGSYPIKVKHHYSLNTTRGVVHTDSLDGMSDEEIQLELVEQSVSKAYRLLLVMDAIKAEPEVDPLAVQPCDDAIKEEESPSTDEGNLLDLHVTRIKEECVEKSCEIKFEEITLPNNFPVVKCEAKSKQASLVYRSSTRVCVRNCVSIRRPEFECSGPQLEGPEFECSGPQLEGPEFEYSGLSLKEELCDLDIVKDELDLEVAAKTNEILPDRPKKARQVRSKIKVMLTVFFDVRGIVHHEYAPEGQTVTKEYYHDVLRRLRDAVRRKRPDMWTANNWHLHHDNAPAHSSQLIHTFLAKHGITTVRQPPYSPDLAPCDFWLFPKLKTPLKGSRFESREEIMRNATTELNTIPKEDFQRCFRQWKDRFANTHDNSVSSEYEGFAHEEHVTIDQDASHPVSSAKLLSTHGDTERFECDICGTYFSKFNILKRHILMHMVERPFRCRICGKFFRKKCDLKRHERQHTEKAFECKFCGKWFSYFGNLKGHKCQNSDEKPFKCNVCGKCFRKKCDLKRHERQHTGEKPFECKFCGKFFSYSGNLKSHERKHTGEKAFKCDDCGKCFWKSCELKRHERRHTGEKPFSCNLCGKSFSCRSSIRSHKLQHAGEKPFKCDICGESFLYRVTIMRHILQHIGEKAFKCDVCGKSFFDNGHLKVHLRKHTGEKPFKCNVCGKCFSHSNSLKGHERKHTVYEPEMS
ncbi:hypothetical protein ANN_27885 [Periplaneta americana]|uniref:C2H2-type domain-containing protein n=1 Tax=Periplaneta americana TaxID=6978 RepID=A0ABQ8RVJ0_PERAM|nr:hypothetical protein ANN_27885 [Periplaneta americana]